MPSYSGNLTVIGNGAAGTGAGSWTTPTIPTAHSAIIVGQTSRVALLTLGSSIVIPANEVVVGIEFSIETFVSAGGGTFVLVQPIKANVQTGSDLSASTAWGDVTFGSSSQLWGTTWATTDFDTAMGFAVQAQKTVAPGAFQIDAASVTVHTLIPTDDTPFQYVSPIRVY